ncbi:MAG: chromosomal replication initiator protein DnaA [Solirubrobacteraceae bacterium]
MNHDAAEIWTRIQAELRREVSDTTYELWLAPLRAASYEGDVLLVEAPGASRGWVADRFTVVLDRAAVAVLGDKARVELSGDGGPSPAPGRSRSRTRAHHSDDHAPPPGAVREELNPKFTFAQFVLGDGNRFAHAAALAVAESPAQAYNPLFLYGPPGVGKTHLLHSIGNYVRVYGAGATVRCTTAEAFTNAFLGALHGGDVDRFKAHFRGVDVLLIDDVQFLESKARTEEEFFHTFNTLHDAGSQVVLTSDRLPRDLAALEDRLRERFESGLVADIRPPDMATRMTVLRKRVHQDGVELAGDDALEVIATRIDTNMRALEGALIRVVAYHSLTGRPIDGALAEEVLAGLYPGTSDGTRGLRRPAAPTVEIIQDATCELFGLTREELLSDGRSQRITWPRQLAMYLSREHTTQSLPAIGQAFGGRNHTTVMHACKRAAERLRSDPDVSDTVRTLSERIHADRHD